MVRITIIFIIIFSICRVKAQSIDTNDNSLITIVEEMPQFDGDLPFFIQNNIVYPQRALNDSIGGTVYISFWVEKDGTTSEHTILRGVRDDIDEEAIRVTKLIKFDIPAKQRGRFIKIKYVIPVKFELPKNTDDYW